ncbi:MAG: hypothetical protein ABR530_06295 [Pyrinomonadaceae bacterium]
MTRIGAGTYVLMLSIVVWGTLLGGVMYSHIAFFPSYLSALPDSSVLTNGPYPIRDGGFWMTMHPLMLLSLVISIAVNWRQRRRRNLILITAGVYIAAIIATAIYFVPELIAFAASPGSATPRDEWLARGNRWQYLSWVRGTAMYLSMIPLLFALIQPVDRATDQDEN